MNLETIARRTYCSASATDANRARPEKVESRASCTTSSASVRDEHSNIARATSCA